MAAAAACAMRDSWKAHWHGHSTMPATVIRISLELAAVYAIAITRNHPFVDGNKRAAFVALTPFSASTAC